MSALSRITHILFGKDGDAANFGKFGSKAAGSPVTTKNITTIQSLAAWTEGLQDAVLLGNKAPYLQDMNAVLYEHSYQMAYLFQQGVPAWDAGTTYYKGSLILVVDGSGQAYIYASLTDINLHNATPTPPVNNSNWGRVTQLAGVKPPTQQKVLTTGTYTRPDGCTKLKVRLIGGGGAGSEYRDGASTTGANGAASVWDSGGTPINAGGGGGGVTTATASGIGGTGGTSATGTASFRQPGNAGGLAITFGGLTYGQGGQGAPGPFGGAGRVSDISTGGAAAANTGAGGAGEGGSSPSPSPGGGGGSGEYIEILVATPAATYAVTIGAGGVGINGGGSGGSGICIVDEYYD